MTQTFSEYTPANVWEWNTENGGQFANINRPVAGATHDKERPVGKHPMQLYSLATPNGVKVTVMLEELLALRRLDLDLLDAHLLLVEARLVETRLTLGVRSPRRVVVDRRAPSVEAQGAEHQRPEAQQEQRHAATRLHGVGEVHQRRNTRTRSPVCGAGWS